MSSLFPWVEAEQERYTARLEKYGKKAKDLALKNFLELLIEFRKIILQDAAILSIRYPECPLWSFAPFNSQEFKVFATSSAVVIRVAEDNARQKLENLPQAVAASMRGILATINIQQAQQNQEAEQRYRALEEQNNFLQKLLVSSLSGRKRARMSEQLCMYHLIYSLVSLISNLTPFISPGIAIDRPWPSSLEGAYNFDTSSSDHARSWSLDSLRPHQATIHRSYPIPSSCCHRPASTTHSLLTPSYSYNK